MLHIVLALDRIADGLKSFEINESFYSIPFGEAFNEPGPMLKYAADQIVCHAHVENAVRLICEDVNVTTSHAEILQDVDGRDKPGHDERESYPAPTFRLRQAR